MARQLAPRRGQRQPVGVFPRLRGAFADAVFVYLPAISIHQTSRHRLALNQNFAAQHAIRQGKFNAWFDDSSVAVQSGTAGISFENTGMTVLTVGYYQNTHNGIRNIVNRLSAGSTGGFNVNYFNSAGGGGFMFSSYNKPGSGDTNWDSAWVDGFKATSGNGNPATVIDTRYVFAGTAAIGPAASAATEIIVGREGADPGGHVGVELVVIWPRKFDERLMENITRDPYQIFQAPSRLSLNNISADVEVGVTGVSGTGSIGTLEKAVEKGIATPVTGTTSINAVGPDISSLLVSHTGTTSINPLVYSLNIPLAGLSATGTQGTVTSDTSSGDKTVGVTGVSSTGSVGTLTKSVDIALSGQLAVTPVGTVTSSGGTLVQTGNPWTSVSFHPSVAGFRSVVEHASVAGNQSV